MANDNEKTHPDFKSATSSYINGAADINIFVGDALNYQYLFHKKIPPCEINNWRVNGKSQLHTFKIEIQEIDRLFVIGRHITKRERVVLSFINSNNDRYYDHTCYHLISRVNRNGKLLYIYLNGKVNGEIFTGNTKGFIFISENVYLFMACLFQHSSLLLLCPNILEGGNVENRIFNFLNISRPSTGYFFSPRIINYDDNDKMHQSSLLTLQNLCYKKLKNDRQNYPISILPAICQSTLDYINKMETIDNNFKNIDDSIHILNLCQVCLDSQNDPKIHYLLRNSNYYVLKKNRCHIVTEGNLIVINYYYHEAK